MKKTRLFALGILLPLFSILFFSANQSVQEGIVPTTINDFFLPGSQPLESGTFANPDQCDNCHGGYDLAVEPAYNWRGSMMAQAQRDPLYLATLVIANQDAPESGDLCIRCHTPKGWLEGRSEPTDGSALTIEDREGITCHFCHKMIPPGPVGVNLYPADPLYTSAPGNDPSCYSLDQDYLSSLANIPVAHANGNYVCDDEDNRRGPYYDPQANHDTPYSPFHQDSKLCGTCHDVSNPAFSAVRDGNNDIIGYVPNDFDTPAPSFSQYEMFPVERTYSEWLMSEYNSPGGVSGTYFGGNKLFVSSCQDCHMKDVTGKGCNKSYAPVRDDLPLHDMTGGNTFIPLLLETLYPDEVNTVALNSGIDRARDMLQHAATLEVMVDQLGQTVNVKIINETGHKLPSGYPEGRRIWINLKAFNSITAETFESGYYDPATGILDKPGTKIYEVKPGFSPGLASALGLTAGPSFHFVLSDTIYSDNRIPPRGFTNENFDSIQSPPVGYSYNDGQYWDETIYNLPFIPDSVDVTLYYQTTSKEYVEFLRDENYTDNAGQIMFDLWDQNGISPPEVMNYETWSGPPVEPNTILSLKAYLEGPFTGSQMHTMLNSSNVLPLMQPFNTSPWNYTGDEVVPGIPSSEIVDWALIELRETVGDGSTATSTTMAGRQAVFIRSDGTIVSTDGFSLPELEVNISDNLFVIVWHRNHLGIMSAIPVTRTGGIYNYNFTTGAGQVYGSALAHKELNSGIWGMIAADGNADGLVNIDDKTNSWMIEAGLSGYLYSDFNMDQHVANQDKNNVWIYNIGQSCQVPD